jgi:two-component system cell cycle response regulator DivK
VFKILLVEDNEMNRDMLSRRLARQGYQVVLAVDGAEAIRMTELERPDLILMDMQLPVMTGVEATRRIREIPDVGTLPIIALTAHAMTTHHEIALGAGCNDYVAKPVDFDFLVDKIGVFLPKEKGPV